MTTEIVTTNEKAIEYEVNGETVKLSPGIIKKFLVDPKADVTDQEVVMFLNLCRFQRLNPFLNEAYLVKFGDKPAQIIVSKEAFMKRAEGHDQYSGFEAGVIVNRNSELVEIEGAISLPSDTLVGGWAKVYRKDRERPIIVKISLKEFTKGQATWNAMPLTMIRKTAIVNALREAFPESLGAMYTEEEEQPANKPIDVTEQVEQEIAENANQEIIDFDGANTEAQPPRKVAEEPTQESFFEDPSQVPPQQTVTRQFGRK